MFIKFGETLLNVNHISAFFILDEKDSFVICVCFDEGHETEDWVFKTKKERDAKWNEIQELLIKDKS